jgi:hypothetical protein
VVRIIRVERRLNEIIIKNFPKTEVIHSQSDKLQDYNRKVKGNSS